MTFKEKSGSIFGDSNDRSKVDALPVQSSLHELHFHRSEDRGLSITIGLLSVPLTSHFIIIHDGR